MPVWLREPVWFVLSPRPAREDHGDTQDGSDRVAGMGLGPELGIVRDPLVQQLRSRGTRAVQPIQSRLCLLKSRFGAIMSVVLALLLTQESCARSRAVLQLEMLALRHPHHRYERQAA